MPIMRIDEGGVGADMIKRVGRDERCRKCNGVVRSMIRYNNQGKKYSRSEGKRERGDYQDRQET